MEANVGHEHKVGVALSGGGAMGFAHIGALQALEEHLIEPTIISGTSMGALIGVFYAAGFKATEIYELVEKEHFDKLFKVFTPSFGISKLGLSSHKNVYEVLKKYIPEDNFGALPKKFTVCATDLVSRSCRYFSEGEGLYDAVIASSSIPGVFEAVRIGDGVFVDGGLIDNLPSVAIRDKCLNLVGVDVNPMPLSPVAIENKADIMVQTFQTIIHNSSIEGRKLCDFIVEPRVNEKFSEISFGDFREIHKIGYEAMNRYLGAHPDVVKSLS